MQDATTAAAVKYFFGRISRDEAEEALRTAGVREGLFLLRESILKAGNYVLSICHEGGIHHYSMERQDGGEIMIPDGRPFAGPVELIHHHSRYLDGFVTKPTIECQRPDGVAPLAWPGFTMLELEFELLEEAKKQGIKKNSALHNALGPQRQKFVSKVAKRLHFDQPWFHGEIERASAEQALNMSGHVDGKYLIRMKKKEATYALSLSYRHETKHYKIDQRKSRDGIMFAIERGPSFDNLMDLVAHYHNRMDGLLCKLTEPCVRRSYRPKNRTLPDLIPNPTYGAAVNPTFGGEVVETGLAPEVFDETVLDEPEYPEVETSAQPEAYYLVASAEMEKVYDYVRAQNKKSEMTRLKRDSIELLDQLGAGNFGAVYRGRYKYQAKNKTTKEVDVAVKVLKCGDSPTAEKDMIDEATLMAKLQHRHIVGMVGICQAENIMLVLELAALGPLNTYLKKNRLPMRAIAGLMHQVALGMAYLESMKLVHRDLAARNVLLASEQHAKISDFGMSKALGFDNNYYKATTMGKWPLKWYAPECIYFHKFDSKTDVWSYGIALWEATSYGEKPYRGFRGNELIRLISEEGKRLDKPRDCPDSLYAVMQQCWQRLPKDRPTFKELVVTMSRPF